VFLRKRILFLVSEAIGINWYGMVVFMLQLATMLGSRREMRELNHKFRFR
jgi:hypothetical protein